MQQQQMLHAIAAQASTPLERRHWKRQQDAEASEHALHTRLQRLYTYIRAKDDATKTRFLAQYHLDQQQLLGLLSPWGFEDPLALPRWVEELEHVLSTFAGSPHEQASTCPSDRSLCPDDPLPFEELFVPFIRSARHQLSQDTASSWLSATAHASLERWLLASLCGWAGAALQLEFSLFRSQGWWSHPSPEDERRRERYEAFLARYQGQGLLPFFQEYSVLARLLLLLVEQWVDACREFVHRLHADMEELTHVFHHGQPLGSIIELEPGCSDSHHQGRTVFIVTFATGVKVVYKPRSLEMDQAFFTLVFWCNTHGLPLPLKELRVLSRASHGWMEYVEQTPCTSQQDVQNYYRRCGMLLCLLYVLGGTDMHYENLVACGEHPVLIDLEMVVSPGAPHLLWYKQTSSHSLPPEALYEQTVLYSGLLPSLSSFQGMSQKVDHSALGGVDEAEVVKTVTRWKQVNTDAMSIRQEETSITLQSENRVLFQQTTVNPSLYTEEVITGFRQCYHFFLAHQQTLLTSRGALASFDHCPLRVTLRRTEVYANALARLKHPQFLRDGSDRWIELQSFKRPLSTTLAEPRLWALAEAEIQALERLDIPWFMTTVTSRDLWTDTGVLVKEAFSLTARERIQSRLRSLETSDLERQSTLIRSSFFTRWPSNESVPEKLPDDAEAWKASDACSPSELVATARDIGRELRIQAFADEQGNTSWIGFHLDPSSESFSLRPVRFDLYDGACGIALFLAALDHVTGESTYQDLVVAGLQHFCQRVRHVRSSSSEPFPKQWVVGGTSGLGSCLYALAHIGTWLHMPELLEVARQAASLLTEEDVRADQSLDVMAGSAGALLGLLALYEQVGDEELLGQAQLCGQHLLEQRVATESGARCWATIRRHPLTGFSHGTAGIAYALLRLAQATGQPAFKEAAQEAMAYERHLFSPEHGNWPDLRETSKAADSQAPVFSTSWCHGASGIGLARLGGLATLDTPQVQSELSVALHTTVSSGLSSLDALCCGNFGRIEFLVAASQRLQQPQWLEVARQWASLLIHRAAQQGGFHFLSEFPRQAYHPTLFQGSAGIGYELLRVAFPDKLPSVLLWE